MGPKRVPKLAPLQDEGSHWKRVASKSGVLPEGSSITAAEVEGMRSLVRFLKACHEHHTTALEAVNSFWTMDFRNIDTLTLANMI